MQNLSMRRSIEGRQSLRQLLKDQDDHYNDKMSNLYQTMRYKEKMGT